MEQAEQVYECICINGTIPPSLTSSRVGNKKEISLNDYTITTISTPKTNKTKKLQKEVVDMPRHLYQ